MAQAASSSQREPSMEEILASIRRIIEDNDMPRASEAVALDTAIRPAANDPVSRRAEAPAAEIAPDLAMELAGALDDEDVEIYDTSVNDLDAVIARSVQADTGWPDDPAWSVRPASERSETKVEVNAPAPVQAATVRPAIAQSAAAEARSSIVSEQTGRQVAASFGELSEAFAASRRRSFDEIAEDMLRPMLQDWLDNNLPTLVERLVREEIERVARGV